MVICILVLLTLCIVYVVYSKKYKKTNAYLMDLSSGYYKISVSFKASSEIRSRPPDNLLYENMFRHCINISLVIFDYIEADPPNLISRELRKELARALIFVCNIRIPTHSNGFAHDVKALEEGDKRLSALFEQLIGPTK